MGSKALFLLAGNDVIRSFRCHHRHHVLVDGGDVGVENLTLSKEQFSAIRVADLWMQHGNKNVDLRKQHLTIGGYAGTGKTTILSALADSVERYGGAVVSPTAKAASVLRNKGIGEAMTIHSLIYWFKGTRIDHRDNEVPVFDLKAGGDELPRFLVCDEASMVNSETVDDIESLGLRVLWVGDHGQLAPVGGDPGLMRKPEIVLETIHRQAKENPIVRLAHHVRTGGALSPDWHDGDQINIANGIQPYRLAKWFVRSGYDQIITASNKDRHLLNQLVRKELGREKQVEVGDRLICLFNDYKQMIFNGEIGTVTAVHDESETYWVCDLTLETGEVRHSVRVQKLPLGNPEYKSSERDPKSVVFDYGNAITCHKAQGSEWGKVLVVDRAFGCWDHRRWRYTAYTRAKENLAICLY